MKKKVILNTLTNKYIKGLFFYEEVNLLKNATNFLFLPYVFLYFVKRKLGNHYIVSKFYSPSIQMEIEHKEKFK